MEIIFATQNKNKAYEIQHLLGVEFVLSTLNDLNFNDEIPETGNTLRDNALIKAMHIYSRFNKPVFADDTGLEVDALNGLPGVFSARFAGEQKNDKQNLEKLILDMKYQENRKARFKTVIAFINNDEQYFFEGVVEGKISREPIGNSGFGYDPVFIPNGFNESFAQMDISVKNSISHRAIAFNKFVEFLNKQVINIIK